LLKPISFQRFLQACEKVHDNLLAQNKQNIVQQPSQQEENQSDYFFVKKKK